jgi:hydrogenase maturation protease
MKTLVLGLGNSILSDDAVGLRVIGELKNKIDRPDITILDTELGGLNLFELLVGYDKAIIVDAIKTAEGKPGRIYKLNLESQMGTRHTDSTHHMDFASAIKLGRKLGMDLPEEIIIFGIEAEDTNTFCERCTQVLERAIPSCVAAVLHEINIDNTF